MSMGHTPYEAMLGRAPPSKDRVSTESIPMDEWVQEQCVALGRCQKREKILEECTMDNGRHEYKVKLATLTSTTGGSQKRTFTPTICLSSSKQVGSNH